MNKYKYDDLKKLVDKLEKHSKRGDITISLEARTGALEAQYTSNVDTDTTIEVYPSDLNKYVTIKETKWLN